MTLLEKLQTMAAGCRMDDEIGMAELLEQAASALDRQRVSEEALALARQYRGKHSDTFASYNDAVILAEALLRLAGEGK